MNVRSTNVYVGPNVYANFPVIRQVIDLGVLEEWPTMRLGRDFVDALVERLPGLQEHGCSYGEPGGFIRRMTEDEGTWIGHVLEHVVIELQHIAGSDVTFGKTRSTGTDGEYWMVFEYKQKDVGLEAARLGRELLLHLLPDDLKQQIDGAADHDFDWDTERDDFIRYAQRREFGPSTQSLVDAAKARDIPWIRLNRYSLVQLGYGKYQKRIQATVTSETRHIAVEVASDKEDTRNILSDLGLPVPKQELVYSEREALRAARRIGGPVVLKPLNANHGRGVSINLTTEDQIRTAFGVASEEGRGSSVLVESFVTGFDHRMLVVNGQLVAVAKRVPGHVVGDGEHTIAELVEIVNADPRRGVGHEKVLTKLQFDEQAERLLEKADYTKETVLPEGETFFLRSTANLSTGGTSIDLTDACHPDNRDMAVRAVQAVGLDVGGVDFLSDDVTRSWREVGGAIVEVNAAPGFRMHVAPSEGTPRDVAGPVMDMLFPPGTPSRVPIAAITGTNGKTTTTRMLAHILKSGGAAVGMTTSDGVYIDGTLTVKGDMTGPTSARMVLRDPTIDTAVLETARGGLLRSGLGFSRCNVGAVLNVAADHLGIKGIDTLDQLAEVKRIVVEVATDCAVLNADDPRCLDMANHTEAEHLCYVTLDPNHALVREHIRSGGHAAVLEKGINGDMITLFEKGAHLPLLWTHLIPATLEGKAIHNVQNALFAAAMAHAMGQSLDQIRHGLRTFSTSYYEAPGRLNVFDEHPFKVILDYAHNPAAVRAMCHTADRMETAGRRVCVLAAPGDRRDEDITEIARIAAPHFDHFVCKRDDSPRGRGPDEVPTLLRDTLLAHGIAADHAEIVIDEQAAIDHALGLAQPGDLVLVFGDNIARSWKQIIQFNPNGRQNGAPAPAASSAHGDGEGESASFTLGEGQQFVRDERGVRLAKDEEAD
ncbi:MAG: cyanophycin synthetase [Rhodothermales bacterium]